MMRALALENDSIILLSNEENIAVIGGSDEGWDYDLAEYLGRGVGYSAKKLWKLIKLMSANIYSMSSNPKLLYQ
ncbi:hypothetical protein BRDCF_p592 [Bacteroidales bacterium CF]|jgi:hypothetical protein|nr:hypothetical protein BRDCF_p592 [Bacteroidales bacterium CF]